MRAKKLRRIISTLLVLSLMATPFFRAEACDYSNEESRQEVTQDLSERVERILERAETRVEKVIEVAESRVEKILNMANDKAERFDKKSERIIERADDKAERVIEIAGNKAEKITERAKKKIEIIEKKNNVIIEEPIIEEPVIEEPIIEEPVIEEPVIEEPITEEPIIEEPVIEEPVIEEPIIEEPVIEEPIVENVLINITTVFNHAYQENYKSDSLDAILNNARNSYILLDASDEQAVALIPRLKENNNIVSAYISVGTGENWRDDFNLMKPYLVTKSWDEWSGEYFINEVDTGIIEIMKQRLDVLANQGFQWVEFDNMDWAFDNQMRTQYGFNVTQSEAIAYYQELARYANSIGLQCMAKNTTVGADLFDGVTYESYSNDLNWWEQDELTDFLAQEKLGIIVHYNEVNPEAVYQKYQSIYGENLLFICESRALKEYVHFTININ